MKVKTIKTLAIISIAGLLLAGCESDINDKFDIVNDSGKIKEIRDKQTGVHYYYSEYCSTPNILTPVYLFNGEVKTTTDMEAQRELDK